MKKLKSKIIIGIIVILSIITINIKVNAMSVSLSTSTVSLKKGESTNVTVTANNGTGNLNVSSSNTSVATATISSTWIENNSLTVNIVAKGEGSTTIKVTGPVADSTTGVEENISKVITVNVKGNETNNNNGENSNTGNSGSNNNSNNNDSKPKVSSDATLKNLGINPKEYDFKGFKKATTTYDVSVPNEASSITIYATASHDKAKVEGIGKKELKEGKNSFEIKVTAEDGKTTKKYTLNITRKTAEESSNTNTTNEDNNGTETEENNKNIVGLTGLEVKGFKISPEFSNDLYEYNVELNKDLSELEIIPSVSSENIKVDITGNSELQEGENTITLLVHNSETDETTTYQIIVNKKVSIDLTNANEVSREAAEKMKKQKIMILGIVGFIVIALIVFIIVKVKLKNKNNAYEKKSKVDEEERIDLDNQNDKELFNRINKKEEIQESPKREFEALNVRLNDKVKETKIENEDNNDEEKYVENNALDDFENMDNLEEFLRKMKEDK